MKCPEWLKQYKKKRIGVSSIKESLDCLTMGLCFSHKNGNLMLVNRRMHELCCEITGGKLENAENMWEVLCNGEIFPEVKRLSFGVQPDFELIDGTVWQFRRQMIGSVVQITATDTTRLYRLTEELRQKNVALAAINMRLRRYGKNVDALSRTKERLDTKVRIHKELGQALLATRHYLADEKTVQQPPLQIWKQTIGMLRMEATLSEKEENPIFMLQRAAEATGAKLVMKGKLPEQEEVRQLFLLAAAEILTNAVRHAKAKEVRMFMEETEGLYEARFTNDGAKPDMGIEEGGGLGYLREKTENMGGVMTICCTPEYRVEIVLQKRGVR